jgi:Mrp family chromosome partitioning ATPase
VELGFIAAAVKRYALLVAVLGILGLAAGFVASRRSETLYEASSVMLVLPPSNASSTLFTGDPDRYVDAEVSTMGSEAVQQLVVTALPSETPASLGAAIRFAKRSNSDVVVITASTDSPLRSQQIANAYADAYLGYSHAEADKATLPNPQLDSVNKQLDALEATLAQLTRKIRDALPQGAIDLSQSDDTVSLAQRDATLLEYQRLLDTKTKLVENSDVQVNSAIIDKAARPGVPVSGSSKLLLALGLVGGLGLGVAAALLQARFTSEVVDPAQVEELLGRPIAAHVPRVRPAPLDFNDLALSPPDGIVEPLERICVGVQSAASGDVLHVAVTGTVRGVGASSLCAAMAGRFARRGSRTLLIDGDHVDPALSEQFDSVNGKGLTRLLHGRGGRGTGGNATVHGMSVATKLPELRVLGIGGTNNDHTLMRSDIAALFELLDVAGSVYVLDAGPMLDTAVSLEIVRHADAVVVLMPEAHQESWQLAAIRRSLSDSRVVVLPVVTAVHPASRSRSHGTCSEKPDS